MIPKTIHYCWFGNTPKSDAILSCIESWKRTCPDFEIKEWNEQTFNVKEYPFTKKVYSEKKWAFVADYARLHILQEEGGFYLDTDMYLCRNLSPLCEHVCVLGEEKKGIISAGMIGAEKNHLYIKKCKEYYDTHAQELITIPRILTEVYTSFSHTADIKVLPPQAFYPFDADNVHLFHGQTLGDDVYGVHLWHYSWGHPLNKFFKKIGIYNIGKKIVEVLGIKAILKKILGFI